MGSHMSTVSQKNSMVINFAQSHTRSRVSIDFLFTVSKIKNTGHSQHFSLWEVVRALFCEKT
ncbi:hypothetical protein BHE74_00051294 [Ensete ventricosum]|nr:hypothetical protein BHE74_00051294 [Ensete ventricosum]